MWQYYQALYPGQVQVLGCDLYDGSIAQLNGFRATTGVTFPLLRNCGPDGGAAQNFFTWYGSQDNFVVINKQGIVRYRAQQTWPFGNGYHLDEIRGCVDSLVTLGLDAGDGAPAAVRFAASPNPARGASTLSLALPRGEPGLRVEVLDLSGRLVARLHDGPAAAGAHEWRWNGDSGGGRAAPGLYLVRAQAGSWQRSVRLVVLR